jgi:hypothetical protein
MNRTLRIAVVVLALATIASWLGCDFSVGRKAADVTADQGAGEGVGTPDSAAGEDLAAEVLESCGNGTCEKHEDPCTCEVDCKSFDNCCVDLDCPQPQCGPCCHAVCQDFQCVDQWDEPCCWNGECEEGEDFENCPEDCPPQPACGDGICQEGEDPCECPQDCLDFGMCCDDADCPQPLCGPCCKAICVGGQCEDQWLDNCCWNDKCEEGETPENCPEDCPPQPGCGDGICQDAEDPCSSPDDCGEPLECCTDDDCPQVDCGPCCNNLCLGGICTPVWEKPCCWNGECEEGEDSENCPMDCPPEETECEQAGGICVGWTPGYTNCPEGTEPTGLKCPSKNDVCCQKEGPPPPCDFFACTMNSDCAKTQAGCCPCSSGGQSVAIAAKCLEAWIDSLNCPPDIMCPAVYLCDDSVPVCMNGQCTLSGGDGPFEPN